MKRTAFISAAALALTAGLALAQELERINPEGMTRPQTYTHVVKAGRLLFIAGQVGSDAMGKLAGPGMKEQLEQTLENLRIALLSQGADFSHIAKITVFVTDIPAFMAPEVRAVRARYFGDHRPASTLVQVVRLANADFKVEIEATAVLP